MRESEVQSELADCLEVTVRRDKIVDLYRLMADRGIVRNPTDFAAKVGLSKTVIARLMQNEDRMPVWSTLERIGRFSIYWLGRTYNRTLNLESEELAEQLLNSDALGDRLAAKLASKPDTEKSVEPCP